MKTLICTIALAAIASNANADAKMNSVYTDIKNDCIVFSSANDKAQIDFMESECKSFGGYNLTIDGGDIRYAPHLSFGGQPLNLEEPGAFHDLASNKIEWIYASTSEKDGSGTLEWKGMIYRLSVTQGDGMGGEKSVLYAVRLDGAQSCTIGTASTNVEARKMVYNSKPNCK